MCIRDRVSIQSTETSLLQGTQERLEADLCAECERRFGTKVKLEITLTWTEQTVRTEKVLVILPAACTSAEQSRVAAYLQQELGMAPVSYTHLDVYKRQRYICMPGSWRSGSK